MSNLNTDIPAPRVSFIDPRTGLMARAWYLFLLDLFTTVNVLPDSDDVLALEVAPVQESGQLYSLISDILAGQQTGIPELVALLNQLRQDAFVSPPVIQIQPWDDLSPSRVPLKIEDLNGFLSTDGTLTANSNLLLSTQKAIKTYVDASAGASGVSRGRIIDLPQIPVFS